MVYEQLLLSGYPKTGANSSTFIVNKHIPSERYYISCKRPMHINESLFNYEFLFPRTYYPSVFRKLVIAFAKMHKMELPIMTYTYNSFVHFMVPARLVFAFIDYITDQAKANV